LRLQLPFNLKTFYCIADPVLMRQMCVSHNDCYTKMHAYGVLETFRKTRLSYSGKGKASEAGGSDAWPVVHQLVSQLLRRPDDRALFQAQIDPLIDGFVHQLKAHEMADFAVAFRSFYWNVVLVEVLGETDEELRRLYEGAWKAVIEQIDDPLTHTVWFWHRLPFLRNIRFRSLCHALRTAVRQRIAAHPSDRPWCAIAHLNASHPSMSLEDRTEVILELLFTGAASVSTTIVWTLWHLAQDENCQWQGLVRDEIHRVCGLSRHAVGFEHVDRLPILHGVLLETLRMYPPIHIGRKVVEDHTLGETLAMRKGCDVFTNPWLVHRDESIWEKPHSFDPSRFLTVDGSQQGQQEALPSSTARVSPPRHTKGAHGHSPVFFPFSIGKRGCPGSGVAFPLMKLILAKLLADHTCVRAEGAPEASTEPSLMLPLTPVKVYVRLESAADGKSCGG